MPIIYCDGVFDLFHNGHLTHLSSLKNIEDDVHLIVGVVSDKDSESYKRKPVWTGEQRSLVIRSLSVVDECIYPSPISLTQIFLEKHKIDYVYHAFQSEHDAKIQSFYFSVPQKLGIFRQIPYNHCISTTKRISENGWDKIWEKKGEKQEKTQVKLLTGYEETDFEPKEYAQKWKDLSKVIDSDSILDVGCGPGFLGDFLPSSNYIGYEKSTSLANIFIERSQRAVVNGCATQLPFADKSFDHVICHSVLQYCESKEKAVTAIREMIRVSRKTIFIGDLRTEGHKKRLKKYVFSDEVTHVLFTRQDLEDLGFVTDQGWWGGPTRFNAFMNWRPAMTEVRNIVGELAAGDR